MTAGMTPEDELRAAVETIRPLLERSGEPVVSRRPGPGKWSAKQVLGHLVDSASNNHQRFVRAQLTDDLVFPGYQQETWVALQRYDEAPWPELVTLFTSFNIHLARVIAAIPPEVRLKTRTRHNLHQLAWKPVPESEPTTLEYFLRDYVGHLKNHLAQVERALAGGGTL